MDKDSNSKDDALIATPDDRLQVLLTVQQNLKLIDAAEKEDWPAVTALLGKGTDLFFRDSIALNSIFAKADDAFLLRLLPDILEKSPTIKNGFHLRYSHPLTLAIIHDRIDVAVRILETDIKNEKDFLNWSLGEALSNNRMEICDLLIDAIGQGNIHGSIHVDLASKKPAIYKKEIAGQEHLPGMTGLLISLLQLNEPAFATMIDVMEEKGVGLVDHGFYHQIVKGLENIKDKRLLARFFDLFGTPEETFTTLIATAYSADNKRLLDELEKRIDPTRHEWNRMRAYALMHGSAEPLRHLIEADRLHKDLPNVERMYERMIATGTAADYFYLREKGFPLPTDPMKQAELVEMTARLDVQPVLDDLLTLFGQNTDFQKSLQGFNNVKTLKAVAALSGDTGFRDNILFWRGASHLDREAILLFPKDRPLPVLADKNETDYPHDNIRVIFFVLAQKENMPLAEEIIARIGWTEDAVKAAFESSLTNINLTQRVIRLAEEKNISLSKELSPRAIATICLGADNTILDALEKIGFLIPADLLSPALTTGTLIGKAKLLDAFMARANDMPEPLKNTQILHAVTYADPETICVLLRHTAREVKNDDLSIDFDLSAAKDTRVLFEGDQKIALRAAKAGKFEKIIEKLPPNFDVTALVRSKDDFGNTLLDFLGAQGKLGSLLEQPTWWRNVDAADFLSRHTDQKYLKQCDFNMLQAALDRAALKERLGKRNFTLGKKAP